MITAEITAAHNILQLIAHTGAQSAVKTSLPRVCFVPAAAGDMAISTFADTVLEVTWVDGTGAVHVSTRGDSDFSAFPGGLGVFGVMTELLLQLTPSANAELTSQAERHRHGRQH